MPQLKPAGNLPQKPPKSESVVACQGTPFCWPVKISDRTTPALLRGNTALASYSHSPQLTSSPSAATPAALLQRHLDLPWPSLIADLTLEHLRPPTYALSAW